MAREKSKVVQGFVTYVHTGRSFFQYDGLVIGRGGVRLSASTVVQRTGRLDRLLLRRN